jgi:hypothetical protein
VKAKRKGRIDGLVKWVKWDARGRLPLLASSVALMGCFGVWMLLLVVLILAGRRDDAVVVSQILQVPFIALLLATILLSMRIGQLHLRLGKLLQLVVRDLAARDKEFEKEQTLIPESTTLDDEKESL